MEQIKDFFAELKERASSPLFSSFVISWLLVNWPITIGLLFYSQEELKLDGIRSYKDLILSYSNVIYTTIIPVLLALIYTLLFPYVKAWIKLLHARISARNESDILKATSEGMMPVKKYIELRDAQIVSTTELHRLIETQGAIHEQYSKLVAERAEERSKFNILFEEKENAQIALERINNSDNNILMRGRWKLSYQVGDSIKHQTWLFSNQGLTIVETKEHFKWVGFLSSKRTKMLSFVVQSTSSNVTISHWFNFNDEFTRLTSHGNDDYLLERNDNQIPSLSELDLESS